MTSNNDRTPSSMLSSHNIPSLKQYFRGEANDLGNIKLLPLSNWKDMAENVLSAPIRLNVTREQFFKLDAKQQQETKRVPYITAACFNNHKSKRKYEYATHCNLICIDIDDNHQAYPLVNNPEIVELQLEPFNFAMYTTASSTSTAPRVRIIIDATTIPIKQYGDALQTIGKMIGVTINKESKVAVQPMYLPTVFNKQPDNEHPVKFIRTEGKSFTVNDILKPEEIESDWALPMGTDGTAQQANFTEDLESLDYLRPPLEEVTIEDVKSALKHIQPDVSYPEWTSVLNALKHQFTGNKSKEAYELFDEWSSKGDKYQGSEETALKWKSFKPTPNGRLPVTIRTLFKMATAGGWSIEDVKTKCFSSCLTWIKTTAASGTALMSQGAKRIARVPLLSQSEEEVLLQEINKRCRKEFGLSVTTSSLRKDLKTLKALERQAKDKRKDGGTAPPWARSFCYISHDNMFLRTTTQEYFSPESIDRTFGEKLLATEEEAAKSDDPMAMQCKPLVRPQDYLLNYIQVPKAYESYYDPEHPEDTYVKREGKTYVNTYISNYPEPSAKQAKEAGRLLQLHINNLIEEEKYRRIILDYMAFMVQNPGRKIRWAILLQGAQGCGKTFLSEVMHKVLGQGHVSSVDINALKGVWNDWAYGSQLVCLEEVRVAGQNRHEVMNALKPLISNDHVGINERFKHSRTMPNKTNYMLFTNHHDALPLDDGDRRYCVLKSCLQTKAQVTALGKDYFITLHSMLQKQAAGLRHFLLNYEISKSFDPDSPAPITKYLLELIQDSGSEAEEAVKQILQDPESFNVYISEQMIGMNNLRAIMEVEGFSLSAKHLSGILRNLGYVNTGRHQTDQRETVWVKRGDEKNVFNMLKIAKSSDGVL